MGGNSLFNKWCWNNSTLVCNKLTQTLTSQQKSIKMYQDLNITAKAIKLLEINIEENICDCGLVKEISDKSPGP